MAYANAATNPQERKRANVRVLEGAYDTRNPQVDPSEVQRIRDERATRKEREFDRQKKDRFRPMVEITREGKWVNA
jgi:hypothetical protein